MKLFLSRLASNGRHFAIHVISSAFFHAWLKNAVWTEPPKELIGFGGLAVVLRESILWLARVVESVPCAVSTATTYTPRAGPEVLDQVDAMIPTRFKAKIFFTSRPARFKETSYLLQSHGKHFEALAELLSLTVVKPAPTRMTTETGKGARDTLDVLAKAEAATCRRGTSIAMYIAPHKDDDQFTVNGLASDMKNPTRTQARRGGRRWLESQRGDLQFDAVRSTQIGEHMIGTWSVNQKVI